MPPFDRRRRPSDPASAARRVTPHRALRPPARRHVVDPHRLPVSDRRPTRADLADLRTVLGGPPTPPPPRRPRTDRGEPGRGGSGRRSAFEPIPFHPLWVVGGLLAWAAAWLMLYVATATFMLRP